MTNSPYMTIREIAVFVTCCPDQFNNVFKKSYNSFRRSLTTEVKYFNLSIPQNLERGHANTEVQLLKCVKI